MKITQYITNLLARYIEPYPHIRGGCVQCGKCCRNLILTWRGKPVTSLKQFERLLLWDREVYHRFTPVDTSEDGTPIYFSCKYQIDNSCSVHEDRPEICRSYPHYTIFKIGAELEDGCGYRVVHRGDFEDVLEKRLKKKNYSIPK